jgi:citrate synthase
MAMLTACSARCARFYHDDLDIEDPEQRRLAAIRLIAKVPTIAAAATAIRSAGRSAIRATTSNTPRASCT